MRTYPRDYPPGTEEPTSQLTTSSGTGTGTAHSGSPLCGAYRRAPARP
jgi:hypothetical protein